MKHFLHTVNYFVVYFENFGTKKANNLPVSYNAIFAIFTINFAYYCYK